MVGTWPLDLLFIVYLVDLKKKLPNIIASSWLGDWGDGDFDRDLSFFRLSLFDFFDFKDFLLDFVGLLGREVLSV